jgi:hypothetical protein
MEIETAPLAGERDSRPTIDVVPLAPIEDVIAALGEETRTNGAPVRVTNHPDGSTTMEAVQPSIPGLRPSFDITAAMTMIEEQERAASRAEADYAEAAAEAKELRKAADAENTKLRELIRELNHRRHDARYEPSDVAETASVACQDAPESTIAGTVEGEADEMPPATLKDLLSKAGADITVAQIAAWTSLEQQVARIWAEAQRDANAGLNGASVSIAWPAHVSAAHHGDAGNRYPKKGKGRKRAAVQS